MVIKTKYLFSDMFIQHLLFLKKYKPTHKTTMVTFQTNVRFDKRFHNKLLKRKYQLINVTVPSV